MICDSYGIGYAIPDNRQLSELFRWDASELLRCGSPLLSVPLRAYADVGITLPLASSFSVRAPASRGTISPACSPGRRSTRRCIDSSVGVMHLAWTLCSRRGLHVRFPSYCPPRECNDTNNVYRSIRASSFLGPSTCTAGLRDQANALPSPEYRSTRSFQRSFCLCGVSGPLRPVSRA